MIQSQFSTWQTRTLILTALVIGAGPAAAIRAEAPAYPDKQEDWYVVKLQDTQCGYMHAFADRVGDEIHSRLRMRFEIARGDARVSISTDQRYRESLDGRPLAFSFEMSMGQLPVTTEGVIRDGKVRLVTEQSGAKREATYDFDPEIKFSWGQLLEQRKRGLKRGTSFAIKTYEPSMRVDGPVTMKINVHGREAVDVLGKKVQLTRVTSTMRLDQAGGAAAPMEVTTESWVDDDATPVVAVVDMGMVEVRMYRSTREEAMQKGDAPEMFINTFIHVDRTVPKLAREVTYRLRLPPTSKQKLPDFPNTTMQTFKRIGDREGLLTVKRIEWPALRKVTGSEPVRADLEPFLQASTMVDTGDRRIQRLAKRAVAGATTPAETADALRKFVTEYVSDKNLDVGFATASEVARNRSGDCTEHGVLLAALARAAGIPSRGVSGIVQVPEGPLGAVDMKAFGYHMWTQVHVGGKWVDIDAALRQTDCDPTHIALALMPLGDDGMLDSIMSIFPLLGRLEIEITEIKE